MSTLLDGWNAGLARTLAAVREATDKMYTYNPKTAGKQISATVSNGKAPQLKTKPVVKEVGKKQPVKNTIQPVVTTPTIIPTPTKQTQEAVKVPKNNDVAIVENAVKRYGSIEEAIKNKAVHPDNKVVQGYLVKQSNAMPEVAVIKETPSTTQTQGLAKVAAEDVGEGLFVGNTDDKAIYDEFKAKQKASAGNEDAVANSDKKIADINADYLAEQQAKRTIATDPRLYGF